MRVREREGGCAGEREREGVRVRERGSVCGSEREGVCG